MNLVKYQTDTLELHIDQETGLVYANLMAISRMLEVPIQNLKRDLQGVDKSMKKTVQMQTAGGLQGVTIYPAGVVFDLALKHRTALAKQMAACGANVYMCGVAGYQASIVAPPPKPPIKFDFVDGTVKDNLVSITALAIAYTNATGKRCNISEWLNSDNAKESIAYLASYSENRVWDLVKITRGGTTGGTWVHPDLAEIFAQWISVEYRFAVVALIRQTKEAPKPPTLPTDEVGWIEYALAEKKKSIALAAQIEADSENTALGATIVESSTRGIRIGEFAKTIGMGQNKYFEELRDCGIICQTSTLPYQKYLSAKYFVVTQVCHNSKWYPVALVTPKGQAYLAKRHQQWIKREIVVRLIEAEVSAIV